MGVKVIAIGAEIGIFVGKESRKKDWEIFADYWLKSKNTSTIYKVRV